jgi:methionine synthase II (cobalamin-independent)
MNVNNRNHPPGLINYTDGCHPLLIGSFPLNDHAEAMDIVLAHTPRIPAWPQLPFYPQEAMIPQFISGLPGWTMDDANPVVDTRTDTFEAELLGFYEDYLAATEGQRPLAETRFRLHRREAKGFYIQLEKISGLARPPLAMKGQVTGPITFTTGTRDQDDRAIFYNEQLRDAAVKLLALKAVWQINRYTELGHNAIIFIDEPALAGFGSSEFISISKEDVRQCLREIVDAVHAAGGNAGIHVCANTDWGLILDCGIDIVNFDAYAYFDRFLLYADAVRAFFESGGILAWGIVPTLNSDDVERESPQSLAEIWFDYAERLSGTGVPLETIFHQSLISPSCGLGSLPLDLALRVVDMTSELAQVLARGIKTVTKT